MFIRKDRNREDDIFRKNEHTVVLVDGLNTYVTLKALGVNIDYKKLQISLRLLTNVIRFYYYTTVAHKKATDFESMRPLLDWLEYNSYQVVTKPVKEFQNDGKRVAKGNMDVEMTVDAMRLATYQTIDHLVLFSGNGDLRALVAGVQELGVRVTVVSTRKAESQGVADELRRQADHFVDLDDLDIFVE